MTATAFGRHQRGEKRPLTQRRPGFFQFLSTQSVAYVDVESPGPSTTPADERESARMRRFLKLWKLEVKLPGYLFSASLKHQRNSDASTAVSCNLHRLPQFSARCVLFRKWKMHSEQCIRERRKNHHALDRALWTSEMRSFSSVCPVFSRSVNRSRNWHTSCT